MLILLAAKILLHLVHLPYSHMKTLMTHPHGIHHQHHKEDEELFQGQYYHPASCSSAIIIHFRHHQQRKTSELCKTEKKWKAALASGENNKRAMPASRENNKGVVGVGGSILAWMMGIILA
jgi:hypothetical protein